MYAYKGEAFISKQKNGCKILNTMVVIPWNSCTCMRKICCRSVMYKLLNKMFMYKLLKLKLSLVQQQQLLLAHSYNLVNQESRFFTAQRSSHNDYSIFTNINLYINIVQIMNIGYWCYWKQYQKLVINSPTNDWM